MSTTIGQKKYSDEAITAACTDSKTIRQVMEKIGANRLSSSSHTNISRRIKALGIDTSHFGGWHPPTNHGGGKTRKLPSEILKLFSRESECPRSTYLRRALIEIGVPHACECGQGPEWKGRKLVLQVDHRNGRREDCRKANLRFLCPNCHSQTETFGVRKLVYR